MNPGAVSRPATLAAITAAGCLALLSRPWLIRASTDPTSLLVLLFVLLGAVGVAWPLPPQAAARPRAAAAGALVLGVLAFIAGRELSGGATSALLLRAVALNSLAAVAEEAFFRRLVFGALSTYGATVAVTGSALAFAAVHVTVWGAAVLPVDVAAGLVLSWQRQVSGRWSVPAATHVVANLLAAM